MGIMVRSLLWVVQDLTPSAIIMGFRAFHHLRRFCELLF